MGKLVTLIVVVVFAVLGAGLAALNTASVTLNYYYGTWELPLALLVGVCVAIGMLVGLMVNAVTVLRLKRQIAKVERAAAKQQKTEATTRLVPIKQW